MPGAHDENEKEEIDQAQYEGVEAGVGGMYSSSHQRAFGSYDAEEEAMVGNEIVNQEGDAPGRTLQEYWR